MRRRGFVVYDDKNVQKKRKESTNKRSLRIDSDIDLSDTTETSPLSVLNNVTVEQTLDNKSSGSNGAKILSLVDVSRKIQKKRKLKPNRKGSLISNMVQYSTTVNNISNHSNITNILNVLKRDITAHSINQSNITNIIGESEIKRSNFSSARNRPLLGFLLNNTNSLSSSQVNLNIKDKNSMVSDLKNALWKLNAKTKLFDDKYYDILLTIKNISRVSLSEVVVLTSVNDIEKSYILHNPNKLETIDKISSVFNKIAINSRSIVELNDKLSWCLQWKIVPI